MPMQGLYLFLLNLRQLTWLGSAMPVRSESAECQAYDGSETLTLP